MTNFILRIKEQETCLTLQEHDDDDDDDDDEDLFLIFVYSSSLHVSRNQVLIIRRISCINTTSGICHSV